MASRYNARIQFLIAQTRILRSRIDASRIVPTPEEKEELLRWGASFNHKIDGVMEVVKPATYRKWLRMKRRKVPFKVSGRPRIPECVRKIVRRMAVENVLWGYDRIVGELKKIGCRLGKTTVKRILKEEGIHPLPRKSRKRPPIKWIELRSRKFEGCFTAIHTPWRIRNSWISVCLVLRISLLTIRRTDKIRTVVT